jgi:hypothetical protein
MLRLHAPLFWWPFWGIHLPPITCRLDATINFLVPPPRPCTSWVWICCDGGCYLLNLLGFLPLDILQFSTLGRVMMMHGQVQRTLVHERSAQMDGFGRLLRRWVSRHSWNTIRQITRLGNGILNTLWLKSVFIIIKELYITMRSLWYARTTV